LISNNELKDINTHQTHFDRTAEVDVFSDPTVPDIGML